MTHGEDTSLANLVWQLWRSLLPAALIASVVAVAVFIVASNAPPVYLSSATLIASNTNPGLVRFDIVLAAPTPIDLVAYRTMAQNPSIVEGARRFLSDPALLDQADVTSTSEIMHLSGIIRIHARAHSPDVAAEVANAVARSLATWDQERSRANLAEIVSVLQQQVEAIAAEVADLQSTPGMNPDELEAETAALSERQQQLAMARSLRASALGALDLVEVATVPSAPIAPLPRSYAGIAFLGTLIVVFGLSLLSRALNPRITSAADVREATGLPLAASFERDDRAAHVNAAGMGFLRAHIDLLSLRDEGPRVVVCTSPSALPAKHHLVAGLAVSLVEDGERVLVVDADPTDASPGAVLGMAHRPKPRASRKTVASADGHASASITAHPDGFDVLGVGLAGTAGDRLRRGFGAMLDRWRGHYDVVLVNAAPVLDAPQVPWLAAHASSVLLTVDVRRSAYAELQQAAAWFERMQLEDAAVVVLGSTVRSRRHRPWGARWRLGRRSGLRQRELIKGF